MVVIPGMAGPTRTTAPTRRRAADQPFILPGNDAAAPAAEGTPAPAGLGGLLALQEAARPGAAQRPADADAAALQAGQAVMGDLGALQAALLRGDSGASLARLAAGLDAMQAGPHAADPRLAAALDALRLRAAVELARAGLRRESDTEKSSPPIA